ncbi:MAG: hypothetical protein JW860_04145 [Sedimentisphaerales bacterium]|nr:hypothetical protein [Sedimentisphaerales bacterium]
MTTHICGAGMAFLGFSLSLIIGLCVGNSFITIIIRALYIMFGFYLLGFFLASLGQKVIEENFESEKENMIMDTPAKKEDIHEEDIPVLKSPNPAEEKAKAPT